MTPIRGALHFTLLTALLLASSLWVVDSLLQTPEVADASLTRPHKRDHPLT